MSFKKPFVNNRTIEQKFHRRVYLTQKMSRIDRRRQKLSQHDSLYGKLYYKTRDDDGGIAFWCFFASFFGGIVLMLFFWAWIAAAASIGAGLALPLCLLVASASVVLSTWLLTIKRSYSTYYTIMGKCYDRKIDKISAKQAAVLSNTFVTALSASLERDEFHTMLLLTVYPGRLNKLYAAYKDKVSAVDSIKNDDEAYREARSVLTGIFREDLKDILDEEHKASQVESEADELRAAKERQQRRAEAERNQEVLSDLRAFYDSYKQLGV
ncbi:MAG: hypothetical protein L0H38_02955 [bacterium]|nr:hypothetical protein [bacterium]